MAKVVRQGAVGWSADKPRMPRTERGSTKPTDHCISASSQTASSASAQKEASQPSWCSSKDSGINSVAQGRYGPIELAVSPVLGGHGFPWQEGHRYAFGRTLGDICEVWILGLEGYSLQHARNFLLLWFPVIPLLTVLVWPVCWKAMSRKCKVSACNSFKEGMIYRFSGVSFVESEKKPYIAAPVKQVLDLRKTKREALLTGITHSKPQPSSAVAEMRCLPSSARVDLVGLLKSQSAVRFVDTKYGLRAIAEFCVMDGSTLEGLTAEASFSLFLPAAVSGEIPSALDNLQKAVGSQKPLSLMGLCCKVDKDEKPEVSTPVDFHWFAADGPKAIALEKAAQKLLALQEDSRPMWRQSIRMKAEIYSGGRKHMCRRCHNWCLMSWL